MHWFFYVDYKITKLKKLKKFSWECSPQVHLAVAYEWKFSISNEKKTLSFSPFRIIGGLLSAHLLILDPLKPLGDLAPPDYDNKLLHLAHDLATRLLPAFENSPTGLPHPRVSSTVTIPIIETSGPCLLRSFDWSKLIASLTFSYQYQWLTWKLASIKSITTLYEVKPRKMITN